MYFETGPELERVFISSFDDAQELFYISVDLTSSRDELGLDPEIAQGLVVAAAIEQGVPFDLRHGWDAYYLRKWLTNSEL